MVSGVPAALSVCVCVCVCILRVWSEEGAVGLRDLFLWCLGPQSNKTRVVCRMDAAGAPLLPGGRLACATWVASVGECGPHFSLKLWSLFLGLIPCRELASAHTRVQLPPRLGRGRIW